MAGVIFFSLFAPCRVRFSFFALCRLFGPFVMWQDVPQKCVFPACELVGRVFLADHKKQVLDHTCKYVNLFCPSLSSLCFCGSPHHVFANLDSFFSKFAPRPRMHFMRHRLFHLCSPCARHVSHRNLFIFEEMGYWPSVSAVEAPFLRSYGKHVCFGPVSPCIMTTYDNSQVHSNGVKPSVKLRFVTDMFSCDHLNPVPLV